MTPEEMKKIEPDEHGHRYVEETLRSRISNVQAEIYISEHAEVGEDGQLQVTVNVSDSTEGWEGPDIVTMDVMNNGKGNDVKLYLPPAFREVSLKSNNR